MLVYSLCILGGLLAGALIFTLASFIANARQARRKAGAAPKRALEFSKVVILLVMSTYFVGVGTGARVVLEEAQQLGVFLTFIGAPTATALAFYTWKAKNENIAKIEQGRPHEDGGGLDDINQM
jgi:hypothetical protein